MTTKLQRNTALSLFAISMIVVPARPQAQATDFAFRFQYGASCTGYNDRFDTFAGSFDRNLNSNNPAYKATIQLSLSSEQMGAIAEMVENIRFFDYPDHFSGARADAVEKISTTPAALYRLEVRRAGRTHTVTWDDGTIPATVEADRLIKLFRMITGFIREHPDVKRLPASFACE